MFFCLFLIFSKSKINSLGREVVNEKQNFVCSFIFEVKKYNFLGFVGRWKSLFYLQWEMFLRCRFDIGNISLKLEKLVKN